MFSPGKPSRNKWLLFFLFLLAIELTTFFLRGSDLDFLVISLSLLWILLCLGLATIPFYSERFQPVSAIILSWIILLGFCLISYALTALLLPDYQSRLGLGLTLFVTVASVSYLFFLALHLIGRDEI